MTNDDLRMFAPGERDQIRDALLARAKDDDAITGAAITGSQAARADDRWSDSHLPGFLLPGWLEADLAFMPEKEFGAFGPNWRTVFGTVHEIARPAPPDQRELAGRAWHHALHATSSIERGRLWQAEYWIGALRGQVIALAYARLGYPAAYAKAAHCLPHEVTGPLEGALVGTLDEAAMRRALAAAATALADELRQTDAELAARLNPMLVVLTG